MVWAGVDPSTPRTGLPGELNGRGPTLFPLFVTDRAFDFANLIKSGVSFYYLLSFFHFHFLFSFHFRDQFVQEKPWCSKLFAGLLLVLGEALTKPELFVFHHFRETFCHFCFFINIIYARSS